MTAAPAIFRDLPGASPALAAPTARPRGIGAVIADLPAAELIAGVAIDAGRLWPDDRGYFTELFRLGDAAATFTHGFQQAQVSAALSYPGVIKAFHYHRRQTDLWAPVRGQFQVALLDLRRESSSFGRVNTLYLGEWRPWRLRIPAGVAHGYKSLGTDAALMLYATDRFYDPADEGRLAHDDPGINYDWSLQHR